MRNWLLNSVAMVVLIAGTSVAAAQGGSMNRESGGVGASGAATQDRGSSEPSSGAKSMHSNQNVPEAGKRQHVEDNDRGASGAMSHEPKGNSRSEKAEGPAKGNAAATTEQNRKGNVSEETGTRPNSKSQTTTGQAGSEQNRKGNTGEETGAGPNSRSQTTTGQSAKESNSGSQVTTGQAGSGVKLSTEQRTRITSVIRDQHVASVNNVNFAIEVGGRVPRQGVAFHPLPAEVVTIYPQWRDYEFIMVHDRIVVVDPATLEIVAVLDA